MKIALTLYVEYMLDLFLSLCAVLMTKRAIYCIVIFVTLLMFTDLCVTKICMPSVLTFLYILVIILIKHLTSDCFILAGVYTSGS